MSFHRLYRRREKHQFCCKCITKIAVTRENQKAQAQLPALPQMLTLAKGLNLSELGVLPHLQGRNRTTNGTGWL